MKKLTYSWPPKHENKVEQIADLPSYLTEIFVKFTKNRVFFKMRISTTYGDVA
jgi:hypothetical protein